MQLIYGFHPVTNAIKSGRAKKIILAQGDKRMTSMDTSSLAVDYWQKPRFDAKFPGANHQFCAAECSSLVFQDLASIADQTPSNISNTSTKTNKKARPPIYLALDGITDPQNMGACIRSAVAFSCSGLILAANNSAELNAACVKSSAGMIEHLPLIKVSNLERSLHQLQDQGFWLVAAAGQGEQTINDIDCQRPLVLLMGSEGKGLGRLLIQRSDYVCRINISAAVDSLNVSTACAVMLHHIRLQQTA